MGFMDTGLFSVIRLERDNRPPPVSYRVREWTEAGLPELEALHRQERVRFVRAPGEMAALLRTRALHCRPARTWVVRVGERTAGYLCISDSDPQTGPGALLAREIAGSRPAILAAASEILGASDAECLEIETPASVAEMSFLAESVGCVRRGVGMHGTLKIIDPPAFFKAIKPRLLAAGFSIRDIPSTTPEELAALVFGSVERESLLPLPACGLNYI